eukprot:SAG25_NODE_13434_length_267_cov_0.619048_1_plen_26_part_01
MELRHPQNNTRVGLAVDRLWLWYELD